MAQLEQARHKPSWETVLALAKALGVDCTAFTQEPAERQPTGPGRPRKDAGQAEPAPAAVEKPSAKPKRKPGKR